MAVGCSSRIILPVRLAKEDWTLKPEDQEFLLPDRQDGSSTQQVHLVINGRSSLEEEIVHMFHAFSAGRLRFGLNLTRQQLSSNQQAGDNYPCNQIITTHKTLSNFKPTEGCCYSFRTNHPEYHHASIGELIFGYLILRKRDVRCSAAKTPGRLANAHSPCRQGAACRPGCPNREDKIYNAIETVR